MTVEIIRELCRTRAIRWTEHILRRLLQRGIKQDDVITALMNGEIIEQYPDDYPHPSCLVLGMTLNYRYIHIVCGSDGEMLWLITAYEPNPDEWSTDRKTRKEQTL